MSTPIHLFQAFGVELEYMVVNRRSLDVMPIVDEVLKRAATLPGADAYTDEDAEPGYPNEVALGDISLSNELVLHVLEMKTTKPAPTLEGVDRKFAAAVRTADEVLAEFDAMLLPTGMHPWMDPMRETKVWPHDYSPVYNTFNRIFDCRGHGWSNLQAAHLNLPFHIDQDTPLSEFGRLHAAIRVLLPFMPALSASTPMMDGRLTGVMDNRLEVYRTNSAKVPQAAGLVIPEMVYTKADYEGKILGEIYKAYAPHDPDGVLKYEWANSRGAIARFMRDTIEVRVLDVQECPKADGAIVSAITSVIRGLVEGRIGDLEALKRREVGPLHRQLLATIRDAERAEIQDVSLAKELGWRGGGSPTLPELWQSLVEASLPAGPRPEWYAPLMVILGEGSLARRISKAIGVSAARSHVHDVYAHLAACLHDNEMFRG
ncbi:MAG: glutamate-cysteine ligase family protein [Phycisphaerales bacterium]|jgi:gamma-glutamyl:cysteine ligase YbdK (ATP-grasp superfamily)